MAKPAHHGTAFTAPDNIIFMASDTFFMKSCQQGDRYFFSKMFFVAPGTFTSFAVVSVGENIEIMVANPAAEFIFVQIVVKPYKVFMTFSEFPAF